MKEIFQIINLKLKPALSILLMFVLIMPSLSSASLEEFYSATGKIFTSVDGAGSSDLAGHSIVVRKPNAGAVVRKAFFMVSVNGISDESIRGVIDDAVQLQGQPILWELCTAPITFERLSSCLADVTALVKPTIDALPAGDHSFIVTELELIRSRADGEVLVVVFNDSTMTKDHTIILMHGAQSSLVEESFANITFAEPIIPADSIALANMGVGIGFGRQDLEAFTDDVATYSQINIKGTSLTSQTVGLLTSSAGGQDDGGGLFTVGGLGDNNTNPVDPSNKPNGDPRLDDELYSILPFLTPLDTGFQVSTKNPSEDDILFFAYFNLSTAAALDGPLLSPLTATNPVRTDHTVTAKVVDNDGDPVADRQVMFNVIAGPNIGKTGSGTTDPQGEVIFTYTDMVGPGTDKIQASASNSSGNSEVSNIVEKIWCGPDGILLSPNSAVNLVGTEHTVTAMVMDNNCTPIILADREVMFTIIAGPNRGKTGNDNTNVEGEAIFTYSDTGGPGTDLIRASFDNSAGSRGTSNTVQKIWRGEEIVLSPETATNPLGTSHTVTAMLIDHNRDPIADREVTFTVISGPNMGITGTTISDPQGDATLSYSDTKGPGTDTIQASFLNSAGNPVKSKIVENIWFREGLMLTPPTATNRIFTSHTVKAVLADDNGNPIAGREITFTIIAGSNNGKDEIISTNDKGEAFFTYTDMSGLGIDTIQASFLNVAGEPNFSESVENRWRGPDAIVLSPNEGPTLFGTDHTVTAMLVDDNESPIEGIEVTFTIIAGGPNGGITGTVDSNNEGKATFTYTDMAGPGIDQIQASFLDFAGDNVSASIDKIWLAELPAETITLSPTMVNPTDTNVTVTATIASNNPIEGRQVSFTVIAGPNINQQGSDTSNAQGEASFTYTNNGSGGTDQIQASSLNSTGDRVVSNIIDIILPFVPTSCDVNGDSLINQSDIDTIFFSRGTEASGNSDPRDADGDGKITVLDGRACSLLCTIPDCQ